tara:strand:- start:1748 stop:2677 length:930 start_codon:yes stop_codon:yes gene_type:complete
VWVQGADIYIEGPINKDTAHSFMEELQARAGLARVVLNSDGGRVFAALDIARTVSTFGLKTYVPLGSECHSSCSFVFLAGRERIADGFLGVHQVSGVDDPSLTQSAIGEIYEQLVRFNTPSELISRMLRTPPDDIYIFKPEELERYSINLREQSGPDIEAPHLLALEAWMRKDWLVGVFVNTHTNMPFIALESREMEPLMRIAYYPHRQNTFVEFILPEGSLIGTRTEMELRFGHGEDEPFSLFVDADIEPNSYAFDLPSDPAQAELFWRAFTAGTEVTVLNGYGAQIGRFSLAGSRHAFEDFLTIARR